MFISLIAILLNVKFLKCGFLIQKQPRMADAHQNANRGREFTDLVIPRAL